MRYRLYNAKILSPNFESIIDGELHIDDKLISYIGDKLLSVESNDYDRQIDCHGDLLIPGLKNSHTHIFASFGRSKSDNLPLDRWLSEVIWPTEAKITGDDAYVLSLLGMAENIGCGVTGICDMYNHEIQRAKAASEIGIRIALTDSTNDFGGVDRIEDNYSILNSFDELVSYKLGFHAEYTTSKQLMQRISDIAHKYEEPIYVHNSETSKEVEDCLSRYNATPTEIMDSLGLFDYGGCGYHCVHFSDIDFEIFKKHDMVAVMNPCSNLKLASGIAPYYRFVDEGIKTAIGTDGQSSNNGNDIFREMYLTSVLNKVTSSDASKVNPIDVLKSATLGGCQCMRINNCGTLDVGSLADITVIDMTKPNMQPMLNPIANIVYSANPSNVKMTIVNGKILFEDGKFTTIDYDYILKESNSICKRLYSL